MTDLAVSVAVLCAPSRARGAAAALALALGRCTGSSCALAAAVDASAIAPLGGTLAARRCGATLVRSGQGAAARGRLVWLADRRAGEAADDAAGCAAALSAEVGRAASGVAAPAAIAFPFCRSDALDRVLARHDGIVVVFEPGTGEALRARALASLAALGRPVAAMAPAGRVAGAAALGGIATTAEAAGAVARLGFDRTGAA